MDICTCLYGKRVIWYPVSECFSHRNPQQPDSVIIITQYHILHRGVQNPLPTNDRNPQEDAQIESYFEYLLDPVVVTEIVCTNPYAPLQGMYTQLI